MIFCNSQQLIISCWAYPNYYYWDWSSLIFTVAHNCHIKYKLLTSKTNCSHQIQIAHIKYKLLTSKTRLNGQWSENENYVQFSLGLDPTAILVLHVVLWSRRDVLQRLRQKC